jgi:hypothetical protein
MSSEDSSEHNYRLGFLVCGFFLLVFLLMTLAVVADSYHRSDLEKVVSLPTGSQNQ